MIVSYEGRKRTSGVLGVGLVLGLGWLTFTSAMPQRSSDLARNGPSGEPLKQIACERHLGLCRTLPSACPRPLPSAYPRPTLGLSPWPLPSAFPLGLPG